MDPQEHSALPAKAPFDAQTVGRTAPAQGLDVPARSLPVPASVSPQIQKLIAAPLRPGWNVLPKTEEEWRLVVEAGAAVTLKMLPGLIERMKVKIEKTTIEGARAFVVTPERINPEHSSHLLIHMDGGWYVLNPDVRSCNGTRARKPARRSHIVDKRWPPSIRASGRYKSDSGNGWSWTPTPTPSLKTHTNSAQLIAEIALTAQRSIRRADVIACCGFPGTVCGPLAQSHDAVW